MTGRTALCYQVVVLLLLSLCRGIAASGRLDKKWALMHRSTNWSALLTQPSAFVVKAHTRLRKRPGGFKPSSECDQYVGVGYLDYIRRSKYELCKPGSTSAHRQLLDESVPCAAGSLDCQSTVDCYTAPFVRSGNSSKATISLCRSTNVVLDSCAFLSGRRKGNLSKKFPLPPRGAVKLACQVAANASQLAQGDPRVQWLDSVHHGVWWANATQDDAAVRAACAPGSPTLVTTPTLFVMRDRHANYAHEMEVVSMAFSFLAALDPQDVAEQGLQVVITDMAPPTGFLETWARISQPHRLRILAGEPFPPGTCFRSAFHVYTFAAGIGYNTNAATVRCESPVLTGLGHWLRQHYDEGDPAAKLVAASTAAAAAAAAGPAAAAAGVRGLRPPAGGIVVKNVVWLSRRNLELVRLLLNASEGWKAMRMVRNEDAVVAALVAAVQEWNSESCLLRRFDRTVQSEYERSLTDLNPVHAAGVATGSSSAASSASSSASFSSASSPSASSAATAAVASNIAGAKPASQDMQRRLLSAVSSAAGAFLRGRRNALGAAEVSSSAGDGDGSGDVDIDDVLGKDEDEEDNGATDTEGDIADMEGVDDDAAKDLATDATTATTAQASGNSTAAARPPYMIGGNIVSLERLWALEHESCRRTNVLFKFVDGDFNDMPYHQQLQTIFRTGVLAGVHGAGLTHGFFLAPGHSAVLQLLGESFSKVTANNVFRNMAAGVGNYYEDVIYKGVDVDTEALKQAIKRAMDFVARKSMEAQLRRTGALRLVLVDQSHFAVVAPSREQCPAAALGGAGNVTQPLTSGPG